MLTYASWRMTCTHTSRNSTTRPHRPIVASRNTMRRLIERRQVLSNAAPGCSEVSRTSITGVSFSASFSHDTFAGTHGRRHLDHDGVCRRGRHHVQLVDPAPGERLGRAQPL